MKTITVRDGEDNTYTLTFTAETVMELEDRGFNPDAFETKPLTTLVTLFEGAFLAKERGVSRDKVLEILELIDDKAGLQEALIQAYLDPINSLMVNKGKAKWEANF